MQAVLSFQYRICADIVGYYISILITPLSHPHSHARKLNNHTAKPHATTVGKTALWVFFWYWWFVCVKEEKNYLLGPGGFIELSLRHETGVEVHVCTYGKGRLNMCPERPPFPASDAWGCRGTGAAEGACLVTLYSRHSTPPGDCCLSPTHSFLLSFVLLCSSLGNFSCDLRVT